MKELDTIRGALEFYANSEWNEDYPGGITYHPEGRVGSYLDMGQIAKKAIAALSTIYPDEKPQSYIDRTPSEREKLLVCDIINLDGKLSYNNMIPIITAHDDAIRRECADKAVFYVNTKYSYDQRFCHASWSIDYGDLRAAILGTEPAREGS